MKVFLISFFCTCFLYGVYNFLFVPEIIYHNHLITVNSGDTLWDIADRHAEKKEDIREVVFRIVQVNSLQNKYIYPGQVLKIPMRKTESDMLFVKK